MLNWNDANGLKWFLWESKHGTGQSFLYTIVWFTFNGHASLNWDYDLWVKLRLISNGPGQYFLDICWILLSPVYISV